jgi:hypothetical protein
MQQGITFFQYRYHYTKVKIWPPMLGAVGNSDSLILDDKGVKQEVYICILTLQCGFTYTLRWYLNGSICGLTCTLRQAASLISKAHKYWTNNASMTTFALGCFEKMRSLFV